MNSDTVINPYSLKAPKAAEYIGVSLTTLNRAVDNGEIPCARVSMTGNTRETGVRLFRTKDLRDWVDSYLSPATGADSGSPRSAGTGQR